MSAIYLILDAVVVLKATYVGGHNTWNYPKAPTSELWTFPKQDYPKQGLLPFFHFPKTIPYNAMYMNTMKKDKPCGTFATSTMHIVLRDPSNVTSDACVPYDDVPFTYNPDAATTYERLLSCHNNN